MFNNLKISAIALTAAMFVTGASAASINVGGGNGGLVNLGGGSGGGSTANATVDLGNGGGNGGLLNLGGPGNDATVDLNLNDPNANTATIDLGNTLGNGGTNATVDLGGGTNGSLVNLFGTGNPTTATVNLGGADGTNGSALLDLFGNGGDGVNADVALNTGTLVDLFGNGNGDGGTGATGGSGSGSSGGGLSGPGNGGSTIVRGGVTTVRAFSTKCFTPNASQIEKLANRHVYGNATFATWAGSSNLKIVDVGLCNGAGTAISANANVDRLQSFVASNAVLKASLGKAGHGPGDVIGADKNGQTLTVYVM